MDFLPVSLRLPGLVEWVLRYTPKATKPRLEASRTLYILQHTCCPPRA